MRPSYARVPLALRGLTPAQVEALAPISIHQGDDVGSHVGYRGFSKYTRFKWKKSSALERMTKLPIDLQKGAYEAYVYLLDAPRCSYRIFDGKAEAHQDDVGYLPYAFIMERCLETALFPDLYPYDDWCDSMHSGEDTGRRSPKASYMAKVSSAVLDYGRERRLAQITYDRWIWQTVTAAFAQSAAAGTSLSTALQWRTFSPERVKNVRCTLVDIVRQKGPPSVFATSAPAEWHFPFHVATLDALDKLACFDFFDLGGVVALNILHTMDQLWRGYVFGANASKPWQWVSFVFAGRVHGDRQVITFYIRRELQIGEPRPRTGRAAWHDHVLGWIRDIKQCNLEHYLRAHVDDNDDPHTSFWASLIQKSDKPHSSVELRPTHWDSKGKLVMHYPQDSFDQGFRIYHRILLLLVHGHQDWQMTADPAEAVEYLTTAATYSSKMSTPLRPGHLENHTSAFAAIRTVIENYRLLR